MLGTVIGTFGGILTSSKLTSFRLEQLERKVDKHNNFASRIPVVEEQIKVAIDFSASKQVLKTALIGLGVSAVSAGIAAVMNLEEKNNDI